MGCKSDIFGFGTSNMISRKDIKPVLASFKNLDIFSLSATLTHNGSSVGPPPGLRDPHGLGKPPGWAPPTLGSLGVWENP